MEVIISTNGNRRKKIFSISLQGIMKIENVIPMNAPMDWFTQCYSPDSFNSHIGSLGGGGQESDVSFPHDILLSDTNSSCQWKPNWGEKWKPVFDLIKLGKKIRKSRELKYHCVFLDFGVLTSHIFLDLQYGLMFIVPDHYPSIIWKILLS